MEEKKKRVNQTEKAIDEMIEMLQNYRDLDNKDFKIIIENLKILKTWIRVD